MEKKLKSLWPQIAIISCLAIFAFFVFFRLGYPDSLTDEAELAFRSVGYLDFLATPYQTTPYEWITPTPGWVRWSFHDHPPLTFLLEHNVIRWFGDSLTAIRVPFALAGLASVLLLYLITREVVNRRAAVLAILLATVSTPWHWISRIGLQESLVIFWILLSLYLLTKAGRNPKWLIGWGVAFGLAMLTKYTAIVILPLSLGYLYLYHRPLLRHRNLWLGLGITTLFFMLVIAYNLVMYRAVGHFDVQLASLLGQQTPEWPVLPGRLVGSFFHRIGNFIPVLFQTFSPVFLVSWVLSMAWLGWKIARHQLSQYRQTGMFVLSATALLAALIIWLGPTTRFATLLVPFAIITIALASQVVMKVKRWLLSMVFVLLLVYEGFFSYQTNLAVQALSGSALVHSQLRIESSAWGYNNLEAYLRQELDHNRPAVTLPLPDQLQFISAVRQRDYRQTGGNDTQPLLVVYDPRINNVAKLWLFDRRYYYDGWPMVSIDEYFAVTEELDADYFTNLGISKYLYIAASDNLFTAGNTVASARAQRLNQELELRPEVEPVAIFDPNGDVVFKAYEFSDL